LAIHIKQKLIAPKMNPTTSTCPTYENTYKNTIKGLGKIISMKECVK
jgi:hypothetical protein